MVHTNCCVPHCPGESKGHSELKFYQIPKDKKSRRKWIDLIRNGNLKEDSKWTTVCSLHFVSGVKTYDVNTPSIFPWSTEWPEIVHNNSKTAGRRVTVNTPKTTKRRADMDNFGHTPRSKRVSRRGAAAALLELQNPQTGNSSTEPSSPEFYAVSLGPEVDEPTVLPQNRVSVVNAEKHVAYYQETSLLVKDDTQSLLHEILNRLNSTEDIQDVFALTKLLKAATQLLINVKEQFDSVVELRSVDRFCLGRFEGSDNDIRFWTGFYSYDALNMFYTTMLEPEVATLTYWGSDNNVEKDGDKCGPRRNLLPIDEMFMTLIKLKQGSAILDLAERFKISDAQVSRIFITWVNFMCSVLKGVDIWMSRSRIRKDSPQVFKHLYRDVRVIIDCTEVALERPSDFEVQAATYSTYKGNNTLKGLIGISPSGIPTFVSDLFEGSISDNQIVYDSGLLQKLEPFDAIMADRGFTSKEGLAKHNQVRLVTPHFLHDKKQMGVQELVESVAIARVRIHVERMMGRIKQWHILSRKVPITYWNHINDIFHLCARLVLFWPPLVDSD